MLFTAPPLLVANVSSVDHALLPLWLSAQGVINRHSHNSRSSAASSMVMLTGFDDSETGQLAFLRSHYGFDPQQLRDPWALFDAPAARAALTHVVLCGSGDDPTALHAALSRAGTHCCCAAVCASPAQTKQLLNRTGLVVLEDLRGRWPVGTPGAPALTNAYVRKLLLPPLLLPPLLPHRAAGPADAAGAVDAGDLDTGMFATWSAGTRANAPTAGFDFVTFRRLAVITLNASAPDFNSTQSDVLGWLLDARAAAARAAPSAAAAAALPMPVGFGWWSKEGADIEALSRRGVTWYGGGRNLALFSTLPPLPPATPQPRVPDAALPAVPARVPGAPSPAVVMFSFSQGDCASFDQKVNQRLLRQPSAVDPSTTVGARYPFSLMATPLDAAGLQPNAALLSRQLAGTQQWLLGKAYGYAHGSSLPTAGSRGYDPGAGSLTALGTYGARGAEAMSRAGYKDVMYKDGDPPFEAGVRRLVAAMTPPPRSVLLKTTFNCSALPCAKRATEQPVVLAPSGTVVLSDPVHAPTDKATGDIDVNGTILAVLRSAEVRSFFWVFLDHQMTAAPLERVLDALATVPHIVIANLDQGLRLFLNGSIPIPSPAPPTRSP
jgi:hypothetical protein